MTSYSFDDVTTSHTIAASFAINVYTITASAGANGSISPSGAVSVNHGDDQSLHDHAEHRLPRARRARRRQLGRRGDQLHVQRRRGEGHTIEASFAINVYTITPRPARTAASRRAARCRSTHGDDQSFTITPDAGYHVLDVLVDGISVGAVTSYTLQRRGDEPHDRGQLRDQRLHDHGLRRRQRQHLPERRGVGEPRRRPELHDHAEHRLPRARRARRRHLGRRGDELHVRRRRGERPHDRGELRDQRLHDHGLRRRQRQHLAERRGAGQPRRRSELHDHARTPATTCSTCSSTAARSARSRATRSTTSPPTATRSRRASRSTSTRSPPRPARTAHLAERRGARQPRRRPDASRSRRTPATTSPTCSSTAARSAR